MEGLDKQDTELLISLLALDINTSIANRGELRFQIESLDKNWLKEGVKKDLIWCENLLRKSEYLKSLSYLEARLLRLEKIVKLIKPDYESSSD